MFMICNFCWQQWSLWIISKQVPTVRRVKSVCVKHTVQPAWNLPTSLPHRLLHQPQRIQQVSEHFDLILPHYI